MLHKIVLVIKGKIIFEKHIRGLLYTKFVRGKLKQSLKMQERNYNGKISFIKPFINANLKIWLEKFLL